jgi:hypothetical protein
MVCLISIDPEQLGRYSKNIDALQKSKSQILKPGFTLYRITNAHSIWSGLQITDQHQLL